MRTVGLVSWYYSYDADGHFLTDKGMDDNWHPHALGTPEELDGDSHAWIFRLTNSGDSDQDYDVFIQWVQGEVVLREWSDHGTVKSEGDDRTDKKRGEASFLCEVCRS